MPLIKTPYWQEQAQAPDIPTTELPDKTDVLVIGSGYTGLHAALQTNGAGHMTVVVDAEHAGWGCSTRNGGQVSSSIKPGFSELTKRYGKDKAFAILQEGHASLSWIERFIHDEAIDCDFVVGGRFHAAHNSSAFRRLKKSATKQVPGLEVPVRIVEPDQQRMFLGTDAYYGGAFYERHASLHPARYHSGLLNCVLKAGAQVHSYCAANSISPQNNEFLVTTAKGKIVAKKVVLATNGYSGKLLPWLQRRVIPIGSYVIATDEIATELMDQLIPQDRIVSDTRKVVYYYRASPDRKRIVFGGRVASGEISDEQSAELLKRDLDTIFPELQPVSVTHSWHGFVAYTFDTLPHTGSYNGLHYSLGYCGSGVGMASYLGMRLGQQVLEKPEGRTAFDGIKFPSRPLYFGKPWFLSPSVSYYRIRDRLNF